jgi:hypothetical protein
MWAMRRVRDLCDQARLLPLGAGTREQVDALGLKIAGPIGSSLAWFGPEAPARMEAVADEIERELRRLVPGLPAGLGSPAAKGQG